MLFKKSSFDHEQLYPNSTLELNIGENPHYELDYEV